MKNKTVLLVAAVSFIVSFNVRASEQLESASFSEIQKKIREVGSIFGNKNVIAVFDTDDTLLHLNQDLGGEAWFEWQSNDIQCEQKCTPEIKTPAGKDAIGVDINDLLNKYGRILYQSHATPNEPSIPTDLKNLQADGIQTVVLTSRGFLNRDSTHRHYGENGITFSSVGLKPNHVGMEYMPQLTDEEMAKEKVTSVRAVNYTRGIINTDGQHKGLMLLAWLRQVRFQPKAIVFVDNSSKQTNRVFSVFKDRKVDITTIRYSVRDQDRLNFWMSDKKKAIEDWNVYSQMSNSIFPQ